MNYHKLGGRHLLLSDSKVARPALEWLLEQPEAGKIHVAGSRATGTFDGRPGAARVMRVDGARLWLRFYGERWMQDASLEVTPQGSMDAVARLVVKVCQRFGYPPPADAAPEVQQAAKPRPSLVRERADSHAQPSFLDVASPASLNGGGVQTSTRVVAPEVAAQWLERNRLNRKINQYVVDRYTADMVAGHWGVSDSAIIFDTNGNISNGQHRLWSVLASGVTITSIVATGFPPEAIAHFDDGFARSAAATYALMHPGTEAGKIDLAIAGRLVHAEWKGGVNRKTPRQALFATMERWREGIEFATKAVQGGPGKQGIKVAAVLAVVVRAFYAPGTDRERLAAFCRVLATSMPNGPEDSAAVLLRNWLLVHGKNNSAAQEDSYWKTERAVRAFLDREPLVRNLYRADTELFPLPGEEAPRGAPPRAAEGKAGATGATGNAAGPAADGSRV